MSKGEVWEILVYINENELDHIDHTDYMDKFKPKVEQRKKPKKNAYL